MKKIFAVTIMLLFAIAQSARAQEVPVPPENAPTESVVAPDVVTEAPVSAPDVVTSETVSAPDQTTAPAEPDIQETAPAQEAATGDVLEGTANPEAATSSDEIVIPVVEPVPDTPVTEEIPVAAPEAPTLAPDEVPVAAVGDLTVIEGTMQASVDTVAEALVPLKDGNEALDPDYVVELTTIVIPTKKDGVIGKTDIMAPVAASINSTDGTVMISGSCASAYYVVLLFKNPTDYELDPRSFILNRAYPCENGSYSYSIDRLPATLENGTYYLMVAEQGERGPWSPITGMREITINRQNQ